MTAQQRGGGVVRPADGFVRGLWLFGDRLMLGIAYYPMWQHGGLCIYENGGRKSNECQDLSLVVGKVSFDVMIQPIGFVSLLTRWIPRPRKSGYSIGWYPLGAKDEN